MANLPIDVLYGMEPPSEEQARRGLADLQRRFERQAEARAARAAGTREHGAALRGLLNVTDESTRNATAAVRALRRESEAAAKRKIAQPKGHRARPRLFTGSIGATLTPPYNWSWIWNAGNGGPAVNSASADSGNGTWSVSDWTSQNDSSNASARAAVGAFFRPPTEPRAERRLGRLVCHRRCRF
jgi:hypothetical protein